MLTEGFDWRVTRSQNHFSCQNAVHPKKMLLSNMSNSGRKPTSIRIPKGGPHKLPLCGRRPKVVSFMEAGFRPEFGILLQSIYYSLLKEVPIKEVPYSCYSRGYEQRGPNINQILKIYDQTLTKYDKHDQIHVENVQERHFPEMKKSNAKNHTGLGWRGDIGVLLIPLTSTHSKLSDSYPLQGLTHSSYSQVPWNLF